MSVLHNIQYELGDFKSINAQDGEAEDIEFFKIGGLAQFSVIENEPLKALRSVVEKTLIASNKDRNEIKFMILVSEKLSAAISDQARLNKFIESLGLTDCFPLGLSLSYCANIGTAVFMADSMLKSLDNQSSILIGSLDVLGEETRSKRIMNNISIRSDCVTSLLVSNSHAGAKFEVLGVDVVNSAKQILERGDGSPEAYTLNKLGQIKTASLRLLKSLKMKSSDIKTVIINNYYLQWASFLTEACGFNKEIGFYTNIPRFGHTAAGDLVVNLADLAATETGLTNGYIFAMTDSMSCCVSMILKHIKD